MAPPTQGSSDEDEFDGMDNPGDAYLYWSDNLVPGVHEVTEADVHFEGEEAHGPRGHQGHQRRRRGCGRLR